jgi:hypothetical protein
MIFLAHNINYNYEIVQSSLYLKKEREMGEVLKWTVS